MVNIKRHLPFLFICFEDKEINCNLVEEVPFETIQVLQNTSNWRDG